MTYYTQKMLSSSPKLSPTPHLRKLSLTGFPNGTAFKNNQIRLGDNEKVAVIYKW